VITKELENEIDQYLRQLFPITRSITGNGNRKTLKILQEIAPLNIKEYKSGSPVYDWTIPNEWNIKDAWIKDVNGNKLIDFHVSNIHVVGYSEPFHAKKTFNELKDHLHTHPKLENAIPYRTSYYKKDWGFCSTKKQYELIYKAPGPLEIFIDSEFNEKGSLSIGELLIPGESEEEILISTYICHPSLANDNLGGMVMTAFLARELLKQPKPKKSYRIIWVPETIGAIAYCAMNEKEMKKIDSGFVVTTVGGPGKFGYKKSFNEDHSINLSIEKIFKMENISHISYPFDIHGSDERQYSSQGFRINIASITKDKYYEYPYYHSSLDNLDFVKAKFISESLWLHLKALNLLSEADTEKKELNNKSLLLTNVYKSNHPNCEVMLSKYDLYPNTGGAQVPKFGDRNELDLILWLLFWCDGNNSLEKIAKKLKVNFDILETIAKKLVHKKVLRFE